ncbi:MAG: Crp/Fnr family transcriptional regulator [Rhodobacteraceae bacterium]|nr:Crp/Fnr family transcriptional regulator [Paracoccaceae bacterium]
MGQFGRDDVVCERGSRGCDVFLVLSGELAGIVTSLGGKEVMTDWFRRGDLFGELAALDGGGRVRSVRALCTTEVGRLPESAFNAWLAENPQAMRNLLADVAGRVRGMTDRLFELSVHDVETRVRLFLVRALIEAGQLEDGGALDPAPSHNMIAAMVGANREAVSRAVSRFHRAGLIESGRLRIVVRDVRGLEAGI